MKETEKFAQRTSCKFKKGGYEKRKKISTHLNPFLLCLALSKGFSNLIGLQST